MSMTFFFFLSLAATENNAPRANIDALTGDKLYQAMGREDLVAQYGKRQARKTGFLVGSGILFVLSGVGFSTGLALGAGCREPVYNAGTSPEAVSRLVSTSNDYQTCRRGATGFIATGVLSAIAGATFVLVGALLRADPLSPANREALARQWLGRLNLDVQVTPNGAQVASGFRF